MRCNVTHYPLVAASVATLPFGFFGGPSHSSVLGISQKHQKVVGIMNSGESRPEDESRHARARSVSSSGRQGSSGSLPRFRAAVGRHRPPRSLSAEFRSLATYEV